MNEHTGPVENGESRRCVIDGAAAENEMLDFVDAILYQIIRRRQARARADHG